jgi:hypothetical protein
LFYFGPNEYFENDVLVKTYVYQEEVGYWGDFVYDRAFGTTIKWKEDKDLTKEFEIKKQRNKSRLSRSVVHETELTVSLDTNRTRLIRKARPVDSFFNFFSPPDPPSEETIERGELDDDELEELEEKLEVDYQIGEDLKEKVCSPTWLMKREWTLEIFDRSFHAPSITSLARRWSMRWSRTTTNYRTMRKMKTVMIQTSVHCIPFFPPILIFIRRNPTMMCRLALADRTRLVQALL